MNIRLTRSFMLGALLLLPAVAAGAAAAGDRERRQLRRRLRRQPITPVVLDLGSANFIDVGVRGTIFGDDSDRARFQRYRDLRNGATVDAFRFSNATDRRQFTVQADHIGYRDQRYSASYNNYGKIKASFEWNQIPLFYSQDTATLFTTAAPGVLRLDDGDPDRAAERDDHAGRRGGPGAALRSAHPSRRARPEADV